jgi:hypothetical protein
MVTNGVGSYVLDSFVWYTCVKGILITNLEGPNCAYNGCTVDSQTYWPSK